MGEKRKRSRKHLTDQEIFEYCLQNFTHKRPIEDRSFHEQRGDLWKGTLIGIFFAGPFVTLAPLIAWFEIIPLGYLALLPGVNAVFSFLIALSFHIASKRIETFFNWQERGTHFLSTWAFSFLSWLGLWVSLMALLGSLGFVVRIHKMLWWVPSIAYGAGGVGLWMWRKAILRAIVEGPEAHPWFWPIRLFFATSLGFCIFISAVGYIFFKWLGQANVPLGLLLLTGLFLSLSLLFLGLAMIGGIIAYLHSQKWRGAEELRI